MKPDITKGNHQAAPDPVPAAVVKTPKKEENETIKDEPSKPNLVVVGVTSHYIYICTHRVNFIVENLLLTGI